MSVQILNALGVLSSDVPVGNLLWVDAVNGVDSLAVRGRMTIPFKTLTAAKNAAITPAGSTDPRDTIVVLPGVYNEKDLLKHRVNWHFMNGARVVYSGGSDGAIFDTGGSAISSAITGYGEFVNNATATNSNVVLVSTGGNDLDLRIQGQAMSSSKSCVKINVSSGTVGIEIAQDIVAGNERALQNLGSSGSTTIRANRISSSFGAGVYIGAGGMTVTAHLIEGLGATSDSAILIHGGTGQTIVRAYEIYSSLNQALRWDAGTAAKVTILGARLKSNGSGAYGRAVYVAGTGGSDNIRLHGCLLLASTAGSPGDYAIKADNSTRIHIPGGLATNAVSTNVTTIGGTWATFDANLT